MTKTAIVEIPLQKYALAIHTSSAELGLAINNFSDDSRAQTWDLGRDLSTHLHQYLADFIKPQTWTDLDFIAVAKGPGSFTGTRMGIVTARTLAQQLNIPVFSISTLAAIAWQTIQAQENKPENKIIALQMPAQREQLFAAIYQQSPDKLGINELLSDRVLTPIQWQEILSNWQTDYELINIPAATGLGATVSSLLELAYLEWRQDKRPHWSEALPYYGQHPVDN